MNRILRRLRYASRVLTGQVSAGRAATIFPDDVFLVSYPKSGNTWVRFLIANLVHQDQPVTFLNIESCLPSIYIFPDRKLRRLPRPRILKSHECFVPRYPSVIYVVRDPRDVAISYYYYNIKKKLLSQDWLLEQYIPLFIADEVDMRSGPWGDHVMSWVSMRGNHERFLLLRYEDMIANTEAELVRVADFLGLRTTPLSVARAVEASSAKNLRKMEQTQSDQWVFTRGMRKDIPFIRAATSGGWRSNLSPGAVMQIEAAWGKTMQALGYPLSRSLTAESLVPAISKCVP
jgi:hypothetical protein